MDARAGLRRRIFGDQRPVDPVQRAAGWRTRAQQARDDLARIEALPFGSDKRTALEETFYAGQRPLSYDGGGRITLPESLCQDAGLGEDVVIVGLGPRFQIWDRARWNARRDARRALARQVMNGEAV